MSLDKKFSDFQRSECIDRDVDTPIDDRFCPTCEPSRSFKMEGHFYDIEKPFFHKGLCEYWTRVYDAEVRKRYDVPHNKTITSEQIIRTAVEKVLIHFKKIINNDTREYLFRSAFFDKRDSVASSVHSPSYNQNLGYANLVKIPHFNFESIPSEDESTEDGEDKSAEKVEQTILQEEGLFRKLIQLDGALSIYGYSYSLLQNTFDNTGFVIREKDNPSRFVNYNAVRGQLKSFRSNLSSALVENGYSGIGTLNLFREQCEKIKLVFDTSASQYYLDSIYVLSEQCPEEYRKLDITNYSSLQGTGLDKAYHLLANLDEVINDITSRETKSWIDFTIERFYPEMVVDYGNIGSVTEGDFVDLTCLLDKAGFGRGQFTDYLGKSLVSAFKSAEQKMNEVACRSKEDIVKESFTTKSDGQTIEDTIEKSNQYYEAYIEFIVSQLKNKYREGFVSSPVLPEPPPEPPPSPSFSEESYTVVRGDTMLEIASKVGVSINDLLAENPQFDKELLPAWKRGDSPAANDKVGNQNRNPNWIYPGEQLKYKRFDTSQVEQEEANDPIEEAEPEAEQEISQPPAETFLSEKRDRQGVFEDYVTFINNIAKSIEDKSIEVLFDSNSLSDVDSFKLAAFSFEPIEGFGLAEGSSLIAITDLQTLEQNARMYQAFKDANGGKPIPEEESNVKKRNPHLKAIEDAWSETINNENTLLGLLKNDNFNRTDISTNGWTNFITTIGLCGMSNLSKKLFECLLGGVTIDEFYNAAFIKIFEFMEINTLSLFLNGLPFPIRAAIDEAIESEFGAGLKLDDLIGISKERGGNVGDYVSFNINKDLGNMFLSQANSDPLSNPELSPRRKNLINNYLGGNSTLYAELVQKVIEIKTDPKVKKSKKGKEIRKQCRKAKRKYLKGLDSFNDSRTVITKKLDLFGNVGGDSKRGKAKKDEYLKELNKIERTEKALSDNNIGESVDVVFDVFYDFLIDLIIEEINADELVNYLSSFPAGEVLVGFVVDFFKSCPAPTIFSPPAKDFMKMFAVDVCDPEFRLKLPSISLPSLSLRYNLLKAFGAGFSELILKLFSDIVVGLIKRTLALLEDLICKSLAAIGGFAADALVGNVQSGDDALASFQDALDKAFCGGAINPETGEPRSKELLDTLFSRALPSGEQYEGSGAKAANIISSVASQDEILEAIVDGNDKINKLVANAVNVLAPEMQVLLGSPDQVAFFFESLGAFLPEEDKQRIRDLLEAGIPNLPLSSAICLTNDQLNQWNDLRNKLLQEQGLTPEQAFDEVEKLNEIVADALEEVIGDQLELGNPEGPFIGALSDEALKDVCNPDNLFNGNSRPEMDIEEENNLTDDYYNNIHRLLMYGYYGPNGVFGNALRDSEDKRSGLFRSFTKLFNPNYNNSYSEQISKFDSKGLVGKFVMRALSDDTTGDDYPDVQGQFPQTVGLYMLAQIKENLKTNLPDGVNTTYIEDDFKSRLLFQNFNKKDSLDYDCFVNERDGDGLIKESSFSFVANKSFSKAEKDFLLNISANSSSRESIFKSFIKRELSQELNYSKIFADLSNDFFEKTFTEVTSDNRFSDGIPIGFKFGYVSDDIDPSTDYDYLNPDGETEYNLPEDAKTLGKFRNPRIIPLNPDLYGGSYSRPAFTVEQRKFFGWLEYATKAFESQEGCDPRNEPIFSMSDIKERVKFLDSSLRDYAQLTTDPECTQEKPFKLLVDKKVRANIDGVVRTTIRTYLGEYFLMGIGAFGNVEMTAENYDDAFASYVLQKMKSEMYELGQGIAIRRINLKQEKYWYTFLEQCVQSYNEMVKLKEVVPSPAASEALMNIRLAQAAYRGVPKNIKYLIRNLIENGNEPVKEKDMTLDEKLSLLSKPGRMALLAMDFRIRESQEARDNFFDGTKVNANSPKDITEFDAKVVSKKKLKFFTKILTIKLFEEECQIIMKELLKNEFERFSRTAFTGIRDKPKINNIKKAFFGFNSFFPNSTSRIGLGDYYIQKQLSGTETGTVPDVLSSNTITPATDLTKPHFIVEKYARLEPKISSDTPSFILNTPEKLRGVCSLKDLEEFLTIHSEALKENNISDFYGDLQFSYTLSLEKIFENGFSNQKSIDLLIELNPELEEDIKKAYIKNSTRLRFDDFSVKVTSELLPENHSEMPSGTIGSTGINYGLRICLVLPPGFVNPSQVPLNTLEKSKFEKSYLYTDGGFSIPICQEEVSVVDTKFYNFNPFIGTEPYDLECLINKMVQNPEFTIFFTTLMPLLVAPSFAAIFYSQNFMGSLGLGPGERSDNYMEQLASGLVEASSDDWDGTMNTFVKNFMRREFQSFYLSNSFDGFGREGLSERERRRLFGSFNPFDAFALPAVRIPWFKRRRLRMKIYDADGNECADPKKDFQS